MKLRNEVDDFETCKDQSTIIKDVCSGETLLPSSFVSLYCTCIFLARKVRIACHFFQFPGVCSFPLLNLAENLRAVEFIHAHVRIYASENGYCIRV